MNNTARAHGDSTTHPASSQIQNPCPSVGAGKPDQVSEPQEASAVSLVQSSPAPANAAAEVDLAIMKDGRSESSVTFSPGEFETIQDFCRQNGMPLDEFMNRGLDLIFEAIKNGTFALTPANLAKTATACPSAAQGDSASDRVFHVSEDGKITVESPTVTSPSGFRIPRAFYEAWNQSAMERKMSLPEYLKSLNSESSFFPAPKPAGPDDEITLAFYNHELDDMVSQVNIFPDDFNELVQLSSRAGLDLDVFFNMGLSLMLTEIELEGFIEVPDPQPVATSNENPLPLVPAIVAALPEVVS